MFFVNQLYFLTLLDHILLIIIFIEHLFYYVNLQMLVEFVFLMYYFVHLSNEFVFLLHFFLLIMFLHYFHNDLKILTFMILQLAVIYVLFLHHDLYDRDIPLEIHYWLMNYTLSRCHNLVHRSVLKNSWLAASIAAVY